MLLLVDCKAIVLRDSAMESGKLKGKATSLSTSSKGSKSGGKGIDASTMDYGDLGQAALGPKGWWVVQVAMIVSQIGASKVSQLSISCYSL